MRRGRYYWAALVIGLVVALGIRYWFGTTCLNDPAWWCFG